MHPSSELSKHQVVFFFRSLSLEHIVKVLLITLLPVLDQVSLKLVSNWALTLDVDDASLLFGASCSQLVVVLLFDEFQHLGSLL